MTTTTTASAVTADARRACARLLAQLRSGGRAAEAVCVLLDLFEDHGDLATARSMAHYRAVPDNYRHRRGLCETFEARAVEAGLASWDDCPCHGEALAFHEALGRAVQLGVAPRLAWVADRHSPGRELAACGRALFRSLGLRGVSFRAPAVWRGEGVRVALPERLDVEGGTLPFGRECPARAANRVAGQRAYALLVRGVPGTEDRPDPQNGRHGRVWHFA